jgi:NitT/TauT family transport system substrate-binding protein
MIRWSLAVLVMSGLVACGGGEQPAAGLASGSGSGSGAEAKPKKGKGTDAPPVFSLAWSEYPSWSTFGVAHEVGLINGKKGKLGEIEKKWNVDIVLKEADYDSCITLYGSGQVDAAALTNMDALPPALSKPSVAILPTSTSVGADALITNKKATDVKMLKGRDVYGLAMTVSEYTFVRNLEILGEDPAEYTFTNMDPAAAATAMQQKQKGYEAIVVWNPFVMETLNKRDDVHVLFDSSKIEGEIVDMVVASQSSLDKPGGDAFAHAVIDTFYAVSDRIEAPDTREDTLVALGEKFSHLDAKAMEVVVTQTQFYKTPEAGMAVFTGDKLKEVMGRVVKFEQERKMLDSDPKIGYGVKSAAADAHLRFDPSYMAAVKAKK